MAVGESPLPTLHPVAGVRLATVMAGIRRNGERDLVLIELAKEANVAAVFTRNRFRAAPVRLAEAHLQHSASRYLVINTGNANAGTGSAGEQAAVTTCEAVAELMGCTPEQVLPYSTGVIGELLPVSPLIDALPNAAQTLSADGWAEAADGIRTTDLRPKGRSVQLTLSSGPVTITGIAKGSGMIRPDMATMLAFVATDAAIEPTLLRRLLTSAVSESFNRITVDGDTSTNDACTLIATGTSGIALDQASPDFSVFTQALNQLCIELAQEVVADGEGATKLVSIVVSGAQHQAEAESVGFVVAESPLVKTALFAGDLLLLS
ncbi:MAG: bifunctional glutamate N-acetyltransferase/amino-acid acetyltransferase ArgJ, partial [Gammaproteobacteria bacterium]|nr:bifunctional glutamate N-acetyltransferase/amino-acid acetyltransferase ArgJ [Gammaproteobacteria bacterium]